MIGFYTISAFLLHQTTLRITVLPESKLVARNAAQTIFTLDTMRYLTLDDCEAHSGEFYEAMAEFSSASKVGCQFILRLV